MNTFLTILYIHLAIFVLSIIMGKIYNKKCPGASPTSLGEAAIIGIIPIFNIIFVWVTILDIFDIDFSRMFQKVTDWYEK